MNDLLKHQQALHDNNTKWNKAIYLIKEISIKRYSQKEFAEIVDEIVREVFLNERKKY